MAATMRAPAIVAILVAALLLTGCGGTDRRQPVGPTGTTAAPPYLELLAKISAGTLHFRPGLYVLDSEDGNGYYYRSPRKIIQRSFAGGYPRDGGIFVSKRDRKKLRGYVIMPGGLTHVGNLSRANHDFRY